MKLKRVTVVVLAVVLLFALSSCGLTTTTDALVCSLNSNRRTYTVDGFEVCENGCYDPESEYNVEDCNCHPANIVIDHYKKWPVSNVGIAAFEGCTHIQTVELGKRVQYIETSAFSGCTSLVSINFPNGLKNIGSKSFLNCSALTTVIIPDSVTDIGSEAFSGCSSVTTVTIGEGVNTIGAGAFKGCTDVTAVVVPDSVTEIGSEAFSGCKKLTYIVIGENVTKIGAAAFSKCDKLKAVYYAGSLTGKERNALFNLKTGKDDTKKVTTLVYAYSETQPEDNGRYWHYVDGVPTEW